MYVQIRIRNLEWIIHARSEALDVHLTIVSFLYGLYLLFHPSLFDSNPAYVFMAEYGHEWQWSAATLITSLGSALRLLWPKPPTQLFTIITKTAQVILWAVITAAFANLPTAPASTVLYFANAVGAAWSLKRN